MANVAQRLFASIFISLMAAGLLSLLPALDGQDGRSGGIPVFGSHKPRVLTEDTLVDVLLHQPAGFRVVHADWDGSRLLLKLRQTEGAEETLYRTMVEWLRGTLVYTSNVKAVVMEVFPTEGETKVIVRARRGDLASDPSMEGAEKMPASRYLKRMFHLSRERIDR
ncbi:hypothetical protein C8P63_11045 [Melghirimyces profundicolus]|uniref:Uncharacterized protein n=1 Tax=Melghirimyces profundicolus TaxID=1242148 RepID=A0A2T6BUZ8_9BACL|nr:hypothetical protein [Melghirimyces profundicolus]PTX59900.1 hypothetical protein C8P63_11045 [Melghirimyces profundicolus]